MESKHGEGQTDKQGLYQRKRSDRVLTTSLHDLMESRHGEGQTDKQGLYRGKISDRVLTTYTSRHNPRAYPSDFLAVLPDLSGDAALIPDLTFQTSPPRSQT